MATNVFELLGTISVNTNDFQTQIDNAIVKASELANLLNTINGTTVNPNVNTNGGSSPGNTIDTGSTGGTVTTGNAGTSGTGSKTSTKSGASSAGSTIGAAVGAKAAGGDGWTVAKGVAANYVTQIGNWLFNEAKEFAKTGWERNIKEERVTAQMESLLGGDSKKAKDVVRKLNQFALDTPFDSLETWNAAVKLLNYGVPEEELFETMQMMGDVTKGDSTKILAFAKAYTEAMGKSRLYSQEAYQFINADVPIFQLLEAYYSSDKYTGENKGHTAAEIKGFLNKAGENLVTVPFEDVMNALFASTDKGGQFYKAMDNIMDSAYGREQRISENTEVLAANFTDPFVKIANKHIYPAILAMQDRLIELSDPSKINEITDTVYDGDPLGGMLASKDVRQKGAAKGMEIMSAAIGSKVKVFTDAWGNLFDSIGQSVVDWAYTTPTPEPGGVGNYILTPGGGLPAGDPALYTLFDAVPMNNRMGVGVGGGGGGQSDLVNQGRFAMDYTGSNAMQLMLAAFQQLPAQLKTEVAAAAQEGVANGLNGVTITGHITTGDVKLQDGTLVGSLMPQINMQLGWQNKLSGRG